MFVDEEGQGNHGNFQQIVGVNHHRPSHLLPLHEKTATVGMLLLDNPCHPKPASSDELFSFPVPPGHVFATAGSPGGKDVQHSPPASEILQRRQAAI